MSDNQLTIHDIRKPGQASFFLVPTLSFPFTSLVDTKISVNILFLKKGFVSLYTEFSKS